MNAPETARGQAFHDLIRQIVAIAHPIKIILFGSLARGDGSNTSDIDLMVVVPDGAHRRKTAMRLYGGIVNVSTPYDILVATPSDLDSHKDTPAFIYRHVLREGKQVYVG